MIRRFALAISFVLMALCMQAALAQQQAEHPNRVPQLTSDDLLPSAKPSPAPAEAAAPVMPGSSKSWSRRSFGDMGLSLEFSGNPTVSPFQSGEMPVRDESNRFSREMAVQAFLGNGWNLYVLRLTSTSQPTPNDLSYLARGLMKEFGVASPEYCSEPGKESGLCVSGTSNKGMEPIRIRARVMTHRKYIWFAMIHCPQADDRVCAETRHILDSVKIIQ